MSLFLLCSPCHSKLGVKTTPWLGMVAHALSPSTRRRQAGNVSECDTSLVYMSQVTQGYMVKPGIKQQKN